MKQLGKQTGLPRDVTSPLGRPSFSYGFSQSKKIEDNAGFKDDPLASNNRFSSSSFTSDSNPRVLIGANPRRNYLLIQNNGTVTIFVGFGVMPTLNGSNALQLPPNTGISFENGIAPNNDVAVVSSTECLITVIEGSRQ
jgi:hypothetical protein